MSDELGEESCARCLPPLGTHHPSLCLCGLGWQPDELEDVAPEDSAVAALRRDDVRLITEPIERITADGITTSAGHDQVDVIVFA